MKWPNQEDCLHAYCINSQVSPSNFSFSFFLFDQLTEGAHSITSFRTRFHHEVCEQEVTESDCCKTRLQSSFSPVIHKLVCVEEKSRVKNNLASQDKG